MKGALLWQRQLQTVELVLCEVAGSDQILVQMAPLTLLQASLRPPGGFTEGLERRPGRQQIVLSAEVHDRRGVVQRCGLPRIIIEGPLDVEVRAGHRHAHGAQGGIRWAAQQVPQHCQGMALQDIVLLWEHHGSSQGHVALKEARSITHQPKYTIVTSSPEGGRA